jgi:hypothetical protein
VLVAGADVEAEEAGRSYGTKAVTAAAGTIESVSNEVSLVSEPESFGR